MKIDATIGPQAQMTAFTGGQVKPLRFGEFSRRWLTSIRPGAIAAGVIAAGLLVVGGDLIDSFAEPASLRFIPVERSVPLVAVESCVQLTGWAEPVSTWNGTFWLTARLGWSLLVCSIFGSFICRDAAVTHASQRGAGIKEVLDFTVPRTLWFWVTPLLAVVVTLAARLIGAVGSGIFEYIPVVGHSISVCVHLLTQSFAWFMIGTTALAWPVMLASQCVDGCDCFDALSRGFNFVLTRPLQFALMLASLLVLCLGPAHLVSIGFHRVFDLQWLRVLAAGFVFAGVFTWAAFAFTELRRQVDSIETDEIYIAYEGEVEPVPLAGRVAHPVPEP